MSRYIDADALKEDLKEKRDYLDTNTAVGRGEYIAINKALTMVDEQPTIDAVPVVRCKDCVYYLDEPGSCRRTDIIRSYMRIILPNWFCADGERRTDETEGS